MNEEKLALNCHLVTAEYKCMHSDLNKDEQERV